MITRLKIFLHSFSIEVRQILAYRFEFWSGFLGQTFITVSISYYLWSFIFESRGITQLQGFQLTDFILYYLAVHLINRILIGQGIGFLSRDIYYGTLNKYLVYPESVHLLKLSGYIAYSFFYSLQLIFFILFHKVIWGNEITIMSFLKGYSILLLAMYCFFLMSAIIETLAFWADNIWSLGIVLRSLVEFGGGFFIPLSFYPNFALKVLHYTPFPYMLYYPAQTMMKKADISYLETNAILVFWVLVLLFIYKFLWKAGNKVYTGAGI